MPAGVVEEAAFETILGELLTRLETFGAVDGVTTNCFIEGIVGVGHMAVVALTALRVRGVVRMAG